MTQREEFENACIAKFKRHGSAMYIKNDNGNYIIQEVKDAYLLWQAATQQQVDKVAELELANKTLRNEVIESAIEAIQPFKSTCDDCSILCDECHGKDFSIKRATEAIRNLKG